MSTDSTEEELLSRFIAAKRELREVRRSMSLREKVREVVELQKIYVALAARRRPLTELEVVWKLDD